MHDVVRKVSVVRHDQETLRITVESPYGKDTLGNIEQIHDCSTTSLVARRCNVTSWLIQKQIAFRIDPNAPAVHAYVVAVGVRFRTRNPNGYTVNGYAPIRDQLLRCAP
jgi:hypothetical protein